MKRIRRTYTVNRKCSLKEAKANLDEVKNKVFDLPKDSIFLEHGVLIDQSGKNEFYGFWIEFIPPTPAEEYARAVQKEGYGLVETVEGM